MFHFIIKSTILGKDYGKAKMALNYLLSLIQSIDTKFHNRWKKSYSERLKWSNRDYFRLSHPMQVFVMAQSIAILSVQWLYSSICRVIKHPSLFHRVSSVDKQQFDIDSGNIDIRTEWKVEQNIRDKQMIGDTINL